MAGMRQRARGTRSLGNRRLPAHISARDDQETSEATPLQHGSSFTFGVLVLLPLHLIQHAQDDITTPSHVVASGRSDSSPAEVLAPVTTWPHVTTRVSLNYWPVHALSAPRGNPMPLGVKTPRDHTLIGRINVKGWQTNRHHLENSSISKMLFVRDLAIASCGRQLSLEINSELGQHDLTGIVDVLMVEVLEAGFQISAQPAACLTTSSFPDAPLDRRDGSHFQTEDTGDSTDPSYTTNSKFEKIPQPTRIVAAAL
ncbi:hypothetical protein BS47DRAFT_1388287 [Hydnum rufescens UP504]|uniref:Uncharacterized protein n=1 Tax=Hydnum rufescens UP504 TaxID=1448309 RepID=A0A9P6E1V0_9AGAM|nr:hypothetical protein BS47DRAFT_1388287 [Hydnum rufescens UP504]